MTKNERDLLFSQKLEVYEEQLYDDLEVRARAISNWKKLRILIVLFQLTGMRHSESARLANTHEEVEKKSSFSCKSLIAPLIIDPNNRYKILWDNFLGIVFLVSFVFDPINFAFNFEPLYNEGRNRLDLVITALFLFDMLLDLITAFEKEDYVIVIDEENLDDQYGAKRRGNAKMLQAQQKKQ